MEREATKASRNSPNGGLWAPRDAESSLAVRYLQGGQCRKVGTGLYEYLDSSYSQTLSGTLSLSEDGAVDVVQSMYCKLVLVASEAVVGQGLLLAEAS